MPAGNNCVSRDTPVFRCLKVHKRTCSVDICLYDDADSSHAVKRNLDVFVFAPVAHAGHVDPVGVVLLVACDALDGYSEDRGNIYSIPSARTTLRSRDAASFSPVGDSCHEL